MRNAKIITGQNADYHKRILPRGDAKYPMSRSEICEFARCPSKWIKSKSGGEDDTSSTVWGSLVDCLLMEPSQFEKRFAIKPAMYPSDDGEKPWNGNSKWCKAWLAERAHMMPITLADYEAAIEAVKRLKDHPEIAAYLDGAKFQMFIESEYHDRATGLVVPVRCMLDIVPTSKRFSESLADFKTARDASLKTWDKVVFLYDLHTQAAMYLDAFNSATGERRTDFRHVIQENEPPYEISFCILGSEFIDEGRKKYREALSLYAQCLKIGRWPGYNEIGEHMDRINGWPIISPASYMATAPTTDPDWLSDDKDSTPPPVK